MVNLARVVTKDWMSCVYKLIMVLLFGEVWASFIPFMICGREGLWT